MDLIGVKVTALSLLGGISLLLGFLPLKLGTFIDTSEFEGDRNFWKRTITSVLLCYGGGVLLATSFVHILPEVRESIESTSFDLDGIPAAEILFCCGFFLIYLIEELVHCVCDSRVHTHDQATIHVHKTFTVHSRSCEAGVSDMQLFGSQESLSKNGSSPAVVKRRRAISTPAPRINHDHNLISIPAKMQNHDHNGISSPSKGLNHDHNGISNAAKTENGISSTSPRLQDYKTFSKDIPSTSRMQAQQQQKQNLQDREPESNGTHTVSAISGEISLDIESGSGYTSEPQIGHSHVLRSQSSLRDFLTVLALSCHAIFEGLAVGLEKDAEAVWTLFAAVATHKYVISFCVGLELVTAKTPIKLFAVYMSVFSLVSPLGVGIGIGISSAAGAGNDAYIFSVATLQALAGGTLIYVVVFEVLQREKSKSVSGLAQLTFVILGFCTLMFIEIFAGHSHDHGHEDDPHESTSLMPDFLTSTSSN